MADICELCGEPAETTTDGIVLCDFCSGILAGLKDGDEELIKEYRANHEQLLSNATPRAKKIFLKALRPANSAELPKKSVPVYTVEPPKPNEAEATPSFHDDKVPDSTGWIGFMNALAIIWMIVGFVFSCILGFRIGVDTGDALWGIVTAAIGIIITLIITSAIEIILGMARDLHYLRKKAEKERK